jgi:hypothetical protein
VANVRASVTRARTATVHEGHDRADPEQMIAQAATPPARAFEGAATLTRPPRWFELTGDLRIEVFAILFALGTIHHEIEFVIEQLPIGPFLEYMERWQRVIPTVGWPSAAGVGLHLANAVVSLLLIVLPWRRELLCLLAVTFLLSLLVSPDRFPSHSSLMAGGLLVILLLGVGEWIERAVRRGRPDSRRTDWYGWTLTGLAWVCALTYLFAFFYKLNEYWLRPGGIAASFLIRPVEPILLGLGLEPEPHLAVRRAAAYGTLLIELALPLLLFGRRTRLFGCLLGLVFHLPMIARGVVDFPTLIVAFYAAFLGLGQARELLRRCLARPSRALLVGMAVLGGFEIWTVQRLSNANGIHGFYRGELTFNVLIEAAFNVLTCVTIVGFTYLAFVLGAWLLERRRRPAPQPGEPVGGTRPGPPPRVGRGRLGPAGSAPARASVLLVCALLVYNNLAMFFGLPFGGAMLMYSGIETDSRDHVLMPTVPLGDWMTYMSIERFDAQRIGTREAREFDEFVDWLELQGGRTWVHLNTVRYHMNRVCGSAPEGRVRLRLQPRAGDAWDFEDVCAAPTMLSYLAVPIAFECEPACSSALQRWAKRGSPLE